MKLVTIKRCDKKKLICISETYIRYKCQKYLCQKIVKCFNFNVALNTCHNIDNCNKNSVISYISPYYQVWELKETHKNNRWYMYVNIQSNNLI